MPDLHLQSIFHDLYIDLKNAILATLAYSDVFDYPLTVDEIHRFLVLNAAREDVLACLGESDLIFKNTGYYFLAGRENIVNVRIHREGVSRKSYERACWYGRLLGHMPFVRMVTLTGSLAMRNCDQTADYDYMLVAAKGRVWTARIFALLLNKFANLFGETLCPNLIVSEASLEWKERNLYSAREIAQMILLSGEEVFNELRVVNKWVLEYLPNWDINQKTKLHEKPFLLKETFEYFLGGSLGDRLEAWEMNRKIKKFSMQNGFGLETNFDADICQGNFDHHGTWTLQKYRERLEKLNLVK